MEPVPKRAALEYLGRYEPCIGSPRSRLLTIALKGLGYRPTCRATKVAMPKYRAVVISELPVQHGVLPFCSNCGMLITGVDNLIVSESRLLLQ